MWMKPRRSSTHRSSYSEQERPATLACQSSPAPTSTLIRIPTLRSHAQNLKSATGIPPLVLSNHPNYPANSYGGNVATVVEINENTEMKY